MPETMTRQYTLPANHPCFPGHFPKDPIVPGVVILDFTQDLLQQWLPGKRLVSIAQTKFHLPLRPDQTFTITLTRQAPNTIKFECLRDRDKLATGVFSIADMT